MSWQILAGDCLGVLPTLPAGVAHELGRHGLGIELNPAYIALAEKRLRQEVLTLETP